MFLHSWKNISYSKYLIAIRQQLPSSISSTFFSRSIQTGNTARGQIYFERKFKEEKGEDYRKVPEIINYVRDNRIIYSSYVASHKILQTYRERRKLEKRIMARERHKYRKQSLPLIIEMLTNKGESKSCENEQVETFVQSSEAMFPYSSVENIEFQDNVDCQRGLEDTESKSSLFQEDIAKRMQAYEDGTLSDARDYTNEQVQGRLLDFHKDIDQEIIKDDFGSADPNIPVSNSPCGGCGAHLHCQDPSLPGFLPKELFDGLNRGELRSRICQRCYFLKYHRIALNVRVSPEMYPKILEPIKEENALAVVVVDLLDIPCSIWPGIMDIIGTRQPVVIVGNKVDLLPSDGPNHLKRVKDSLISAIEKTDLGRTNIKHIALVSAHTGYGIESLITKIQNSWGVKGDIYILGCTNTGKSTLFNALLGSDMCKVKASDLIMRATTSPWPGTTLNMLKFPVLRPSGFRLHQRVLRLKEVKRKEQLESKIQPKPKYTQNTSLATLTGTIGRTFEEDEEYEEPSDPFSIKADKVAKGSKQIKGIDTSHPRYALGKWCYDTPGTVQPDQIINLLTHEELLKVLPKTLIRPRSFSVTSGTSLFLGGLARLDVLFCSESVRLTVFVSGHIPINIVRTIEAAAFYRDYLGSPLLGVPVDGIQRLQHWPPLKPKNMFLSGIGQQQSAADVVLSSAGWIAVTGYKDRAIDLRGWAPGGRGIYLREPSILPLSVNLKGARIGSSPAYKSHKLYVP